MLGKFRRHLSYANVMATIAVFLALGGGAYAAATVGSSQIKSNAILSRHIKNGQVKNADLAANSVRGGKIIDGSVGSPDLAANSVGADKIIDGSVGSPDLAANSVGADKIIDGSVGSPDLAANSVGTDNVIDGSLQAQDLAAGASFHPGDPLPSGKTETGAWSIFDGSTTAPAFAGVTLPFRAPVALSDTTVNFQANSNGIASDDDSACAGTAQTPSAPPGKVCIYLAGGSQASASALSGHAIGLPGPSAVGFEIDSTVADTATGKGTWAYTAP
jgi:hypothetical protein